MAVELGGGGRGCHGQECCELMHVTRRPVYSDSWLELAIMIPFMF